jgi:triosephosphate isomerase (TIM)
MKKKIIIANWKMNPASFEEAEILFLKIARKADFKNTEVVICPPSLYLDKMKKNSKKVLLGAQDVFYEEKGAFTGNLSASMLVEAGAKFVILGHSERRKLGETDLDVNKKLKTALFFGLKPIVCVGETERDENHEYFGVVKKQIEESLNGINKKLVSKIIIAYEPVWAISTTKNKKEATSHDSYEMVIFIKKILHDKFGSKTKIPRIIYGGSVDEKNCKDFLMNGGVEGALVGGASLNPDKFLEIIRVAENT